MITKINEAKTLVKYILCDCKCKFNSTTCNSNKKWNKDKLQHQCESKKYCVCKKDYWRNPSTCICDNRRCLKKYC